MNNQELLNQGLDLINKKDYLGWKNLIKTKFGISDHPMSLQGSARNIKDLNKIIKSELELKPTQQSRPSHKTRYSKIDAYNLITPWLRADKKLTVSYIASTHSMEPVIDEYSLAVLRTETEDYFSPDKNPLVLEEDGRWLLGNIIVYWHPGWQLLIMHRLVKVDFVKKTFQCRGDNNLLPDPEQPFSRIVSSLVAHIPLAKPL